MNRGGTVVLLYHRVARLERDPHGLAVAPERFAAHCDILRRRFDVTPLRHANPTRRQVAITLDDGYADNALEAMPILASAGLPATFFITAARIGARGEAWWDRLEHMVLGSAPAAEALEFEIAGRHLWVDLRSRAARERAHAALFWRLRPLRPNAIEPVLASLADLLRSAPKDRDSYRWMTVDELRLLSESAGADIGAHTLTHPLLATLTPEEQRQEIEGSRALLQQMIGTAPAVFSYPHGSPDALTDTTVQLVRDAGYEMACTAVGGVAGRESDRFRLPRNVVGDWEPERFAAWLDGWLA